MLLLLRFLCFFFKIQKVVTFNVFCHVLYVSSNYELKVVNFRFSYSRHKNCSQLWFVNGCNFTCFSIIHCQKLTAYIQQIVIVVKSNFTKKFKAANCNVISFLLLRSSSAFLSHFMKQESPADAVKPARRKSMQKLLQFDVFRFISPNSISPNFKV